MIKVVVSKRHGGFSLSNEAMLYLIKSNSVLISTKPITEFFGNNDIDECMVEIMDRHDMVDLGNNMVSAFHGEIFNFTDGVVYTLGAGSVMEFRTHPDLISLVETMGDAASGQYSRLAVVYVADEDITVDMIRIGEYDGAEWVEELHRTWH